MRRLPELAPIALLFVLSFTTFISVAPVAKAATTLSVVDLSSEINCGGGGATCSAYHVLYSPSDNTAWVSIGTCSGCTGGYLYKVSLATVLSSPQTSVTAYANPFPATLGSCNGFAGGPFDSTLMGGSIYMTAVYNSGIAVARVNESTGSTLSTWCYVGPSSSTAITNDGTHLYVGTSGGVLKLTTLGIFTSLASTTSEVTGLLNVGGNLWLTEGGSKCLAEYTGSLTELSCGSTEGKRLMVDGSGNIWYTSNFDHTLNEYTGSTFNHYATGITQDGPFGLYLSPTGGIRVDGYKSDSILFFSTSNSSFVSSDVKTTTKAPYDGFVDSSNNEWELALGSTDLIQIGSGTTATAITITTTTQTVTATAITAATVTNIIGTTTVTATSTVTSTSTQTSTTTSTQTSSSTGTISTISSSSTSTYCPPKLCNLGASYPVDRDVTATVNQYLGPYVPTFSVVGTIAAIVLSAYAVRRRKDAN